MSAGATHVIALAARTPVGLHAASSAAAIRAGISGVRNHPFIVDAQGEPVLFGLDAVLDSTARGPDRMLAILESCLLELEPALDRCAAEGVTAEVLLALPEPRPGFSEAERSALLRMIGSLTRPDGTPWVFREAGQGHAGAFHALEFAVDQLHQGKHVFVIAGIDSAFDGEALEWLESRRKLLTEDARGGFAPGEGGAAIVLASDELRARLRAPSLARVRAVATASEPRDEASFEGTFGEGLTEAFAKACAGLQIPGEHIDDIYCDINDERTRTTDLAFALLRLGDCLRPDLTYVTPVASVGDLGAASAPLNMVLAARAFERGYAFGPRALTFGSSWQGLRGAALFEHGSG